MNRSAREGWRVSRSLYFGNSSAEQFISFIALRYKSSVVKSNLEKLDFSSTYFQLKSHLAF
jgi:hypothetical protein